jgi:hypothetical protein
MGYFGVEIDHNSLPRRFKPRPIRDAPVASGSRKMLGRHAGSECRL